MEIENMLLTANEVAEILSISRAYAYELMQDGTLPTIKYRNVVRVPAAKLLLLIENLRKRSALGILSDLLS